MTALLTALLTGFKDSSWASGGDIGDETSDVECALGRAAENGELEVVRRLLSLAESDFTSDFSVISPRWVYIRLVNASDPVLDLVPRCH